MEKGNADFQVNKGIKGFFEEPGRIPK